MSRPSWVAKNLLRNRLRTALTLGSITVSLFMLALFLAAYRFMSAPVQAQGQSHLILVVEPRASMSNQLPLGYRERIAAVPGVRAVSPFAYFPGQYGSDYATVPVLGLDSEEVFKLFSDWHLPPGEKTAFLKDRMGLIAGSKLAAKYGWRIGDRLHFTSRLFNRLSLELVLRGIYTSSDNQTSAVMHWDYFNARLGHPDKASEFWVLANSAAGIEGVEQRIDAQFRDAPVETRTETLKQVMLDFLALLGNVKLVLLSVSGAVVFAILLVMANTMGMSIRERTGEIAVLRTLGFRPRQVLELLMEESLALACLGALVGCIGAAGVSTLISRLAIGNAMPAQISVDRTTIVVTFLVAVLIALGSSLLPALRASRISIAQALQFVG